MFAVKTNSDQPENSQVLLSPVDYHLQENDLCVYICESPREVDDVNELDAVIAAEKLKDKLKQREYQARDGLGLFTLSSRAPITHSSAPASPLHRPLKHSISNESNKSIASLQPTKLHTNNKHFQISKLPSPRMALLTGSRKLISKLGQPPKVLDNEDGIPLCYLLDKPLKIQDMTIEHTDHMYGHIVVCMHHKVSNIFKFI
jgi:hypothetical protein